MPHKSNHRPYPNVIPAGGRWHARHPRHGTQIHLGVFDTAEEARAAVLIAQAQHLETKADSYRAEARHIAPDACIRTPSDCPVTGPEVRREVLNLCAQIEARVDALAGLGPESKQ